MVCLIYIKAINKINAKKQIVESALNSNLKTQASDTRKIFWLVIDIKTLNPDLTGMLNPAQDLNL